MAGSEGPGWFSGHKEEIEGRVCLNGTGPIPAEIVFVDKCPSPREVYSGPYTSTEGQLLVRRLKKAGFPLDRARFTYATHHCPAKYSAAEVNWGRRMFQEELSTCRPRLVVTLGAEALKQVVGIQYRWDDCHGCWFRPDTVEGCPFEVFPTFNLTQVLSNPKWDVYFERDLERITRRLLGTEEPVPEVKNAIVRTNEALKSFVDWAMGWEEPRFVALDCEWNGRNWMDPDRYLRTVQIGYAKGSVVTVEVTEEGGKKVFPDEKAMFGELKRLLESDRVLLCGHNIIADGEWLLSFGVDIRDRVVYDTMLMEHVIDQNGPFGLEALSMKYTPFGRYSSDVEVWVRRHQNKNLPDTSAYGYGYVPREMLIQYGYLDVEVIHWIMDRQVPVLRERGCFKPRGVDGEYPSLYETVMEVQRVTYDLEMNGLPVDMAQLDMLTDRYQEARSETLSKVMAMARAAGFEDFNPRSVMHLRKMLFGVLGLTPVKTTGGEDWGDVAGEMGMDSEEDVAAATDKTTLQILEGQHPFVDALLDFRRVDQVCKTWLTKEKNGEPAGLYALLWPDGTLKSRFSTLTETGRYRTSDPNSQNWPKKAEGYLSKIFGEGNEPPLLRTVVDPNQRAEYRGRGKVVQLECDWKQAELFTMANLSQDQNMIKALTTPGLDLHDKTAVDSFGLHMFDEGGHEVSEDDLIALAASLKDAGGAESEEFEHFMKTLTYVDQHGNRLSRSAFKSGIRVSAKSINFGIPYGRGAKAIALQIKAETGDRRSLEEIAAEVAKVLESWKTKAFPVCWRTLQHWASLLKSQGYVENPWGLRKTGHPRRDGNNASLERQFQNFPIQSTVSSTMHIAMGMVRRRIAEDGLPFKIQNQIHDALMVECPLEMVDECKRMFKETMAGIRIPLPGGKWFTLDVDIDVYERWGVKMK